MKYNTAPFPIDRAVDMRDTGSTIEQIAEVLGYSWSTVSRRMREHNRGRTPARNGRLFPLVKAKKAYRVGLTVREIARAFGYAYEPTRQHLLKAGLELRPQGGAH